MNDNAHKISNQLWNWYKKCRDSRKDKMLWERFLKDGEAIVKQYQGDDYIFARDMYLLFLDRVERLERKNK